MEEDIKILEEIVDIYYDCAGNKEQDYDMRVDMGFMKKEAQAIENLIKGYKLEKLKNVLDEQSLKEALDDYIPKSKIKEKLEVLKTKLNVFEKDIRYCKDRVQTRLMNDEIYVIRRCLDLLQELMEEN